eukprot:jgi/Psemu1/286034/fgenesh1_pg.116_\
MASASGKDDSGDYDAAIVAIAIGNDYDMETDGEDDALSNMDTAIYDLLLDNADIDDLLLDNADIYHEETRLRRCIGDIPNAIEMDPNRFARLPPEVQIKLVLELRDREKAALLQKLRECSNAVEKLKEELYLSEDRRMELGHELDTGNAQIEEMKRDFVRMKEAHVRRATEIQHMKNEMMRRMTETQEQESSVLSTASKNSWASQKQQSSGGPTSNSASLDQRDSEDKTRTKIKIQIEFERKLESNPKYREEFERFKEFQDYYKMMKGNAGPNDGMGCDITKSLNEDYRKMLEFQLGYERMFFSTNNT